MRIGEFEVYIGDYIPGLGHPVVVVTGYTHGQDRVRSEYFALLSEDPSYFESLAFNARGKSPSEAVLSLDPAFMRGFARDSAEATLQNHLYNLHLQDKEKGYLDHPIKLQAADSLALNTLYLRSKHGRGFSTMRSQTMSEELQDYLDALFPLEIQPWKLG